MAEVSQAPSVTAEGWHAQFSPSKAERWLNCPGSIAAEAMLPAGRPSSVYADEGTAAHLLAARAFTYDKDAAFFIGEEIQVGHNVFVVDDAMAEAVQVYLDDTRRRVGPNDTFMYEQRVFFSETIGAPEQGGTSDAIILHAGGRRLTIEDYKHGMGVKVDAEENVQMGLYALGVLETFGPIMEEVEEVTFVIHQPRIDHLSEWTCPISWLHALAERARHAVVDAGAAVAAACAGREIPATFFGVTEKGCQWCPIKATCDHYRHFVSDQVLGDFKALDDPTTVEVMGVPPPPAAPSKLGQLFGVLDMIEGWCRAVRSETERLVMAGTQVVGPDGLPMKVVEGKKGNRRWSDERIAGDTLVTVLGPDKAFKPQELISPSVAEKALGKKRKAEFDALLRPLTTQSDGAPKLALGSSPLPPYQGAAKSDEFEDLGDAS